MIRNEVGKGVIYLYIQLISTMISGYVFLILLARITTTEIIGTFSLLISISEIFANIAIIGLPESIQKFVGRSFLQHMQADAKVFIKISFVLLSASIVVSCLVIIIIKDWFSNVFGLDFSMIIIIDLLITSYAIFTVLYSTVVATLKTKILPIILIISSIAKVILALTLVLMGYGVHGLTLGYTFFGQALSSVLLGIFIFKIFKSNRRFAKREVTVSSINAAKRLATGGFVIWIPVLVTTLGIDLGTLVLYSSYGSYESGIYFIALAISNAINAVVYSIFTISLPVLSSMSDGRKRFVWQTIRISAIIALPLSSSLIFFSDDVMNLIGSNYEEGSFPLQILLLSTFPMILSGGIETLVFSYGQYRRTLTISLASSIPRTVLYFLIVPILGITGVAISYTIGTLIGFMIAILVSNRIGMLIYWKPLILTLLFPLSLAYLLSILNVSYVIGIVTTIGVTYLLLMKLHVIEKRDGLFLTELMPDNISRPLIKIYSRFEKVMAWFYK